MSDDDLRKYMPRVSSILRHADPKRAAERKEGALASTETRDARETLPGVAPPAANPWAAESSAEKPIDPALLPSAHQPGEVPLDGIETPVGAPPSRVGARRGIALAAVLACAAGVAVVLFFATREAPTPSSPASLPSAGTTVPTTAAPVAAAPDTGEGGAAPLPSARDTAPEIASVPSSSSTAKAAPSSAAKPKATAPAPAPVSSNGPIMNREEPDE